MSYLLRRRAEQLLEQCDKVTEHHLKLSDQPQGSKTLEIGWKGHTFRGWCERNNDIANIVIFMVDEDGTNLYRETSCDDNIKSIETSIKDTVKKLVSHT